MSDIAYDVVNSFPHDTDAFTEGLAFYEDCLYESTGKTDRGPSTLRCVEISTGRVLQRYDLPERYFAEGLTILNGQIFQLTYLEETAFVFDIRTFRLLDTFTYKNEGWGLTNDGNALLASDGSNKLNFIDPVSFKPLREPSSVMAGGHPLDQLNELEYVNGFIYANVWFTDFIYRIDSRTGQAERRIDLSLLRPPETKGGDCLECVPNGIAFNQKANSFYVTGKLWPVLFEIRLRE